MGGQRMINLSASSITTYKACPMRYYYQYVLGLVPIEDTDSQRVGSNWHRIQEIANMEPGGICECSNNQNVNPNCPLCQGTGKLPNDLTDAVVDYLNWVYDTPPISKTEEEWETERNILFYSLIGYQWYYQDTEYKTEQLEQKFEIPLLSPITKRKLRANLRGKIDRIFSAGSNKFVHEYKSTSKNIDLGSTYWGHLTLDTQTRLYTYAANQLGLGICGVLYDVWHKPQIKPKKLTQADSKKFIASGEYCGEKFAITTDQQLPFDGGEWVRVNGRLVEVKFGAKLGTFTIKETPEMFSARLLQDIAIRPEYYFVRKEIAHYTNDIGAFEWQLFNIYHSIRQMTAHKSFWRNEHECERTFKCSYIDWCYNHVDVGPDDVPEGFRKVGG